LPKYYVDLHIHIGSTTDNLPVKITASKKLNIANIIEECVFRKGINIVGIVDCGSPLVIREIEISLQKGELFQLKKGGLSYQDKLTIIPGMEVESNELNGGRGHYVSFFPTLAQIKEYSHFLSSYIKNINLSTQQSYLPAKRLLEATLSLDGIFFPAHAFTPHKSLFGSCGDSLESVFSHWTPHVSILELGLSSDSQMADTISELHSLTFLSNSDAHSLEKIGREYNLIEMEDPTFQGLRQALNLEKGNVIANFGLNPRIGKYHRNFCEKCKKPIDTDEQALCCPYCLNSRITKGVYDRLLEISDVQSFNSVHRPPYNYQIPLSFLPKVGPKTINKLINNFGTEMDVLHTVTYEDLERVVGQKVAHIIEKARKGQMIISPGGGGIYGKITES